ncbi:MAG: FliH/SctL family protein [Nitrospinota bacterium]
MSRVISADENLENDELTPFSFRDFEGDELPFQPGKTDESFESDFGKEEHKKSKFRLGDGFSFKLFAGLEDEEERDQAEQFLQEIERKAENIEKEAYKRGLEVGRESGRSEILAEFGPVFQSFKDGLQTLVTAKERLFKESENEIVKFILLIAKKVIRREVEVEQDVVNHVTKWALMQLIDKDEVIIKINPDDMEIAARYQEDLKKDVEGLKGVVLESDSSISRGGCIIETNFGSVDARIEPQLHEIEKALVRSIEENRSQMKI